MSLRWINVIYYHNISILTLCFQALAVKIFSAMPISMVDEHAMSIVTWLNGPRRRRQKVSTVADHLVIRGFDQLNEKVRS